MPPTISRLRSLAAHRCTLVAMWNKRVGMPRHALRAWVLVVLVGDSRALASADGGASPTDRVPQRYPAPAWIDARLPLRRDIATPHFLLAYQTSHARILRDGKPWLNVAEHIPGASVVRADPVGDDAVLSLYVGANRPYAVYRYRPGGPLLPICDSRVGAAVRKGRSLLFVRGSTVLERDLDGTHEQVRQRFSAQDLVERIDAFQDSALVLVKRRDNTRDVFVLGAAQPILRGVEFGSATVDGWAVNLRGKNWVVGGDGGLRALPIDRQQAVVDVALPPLSQDVRTSSAVVALLADGTAWRRTPWVVDVEGYEVHRAMRGEVLAAHRLQVVRSVDGSSAAWRESESDPWRLLDGTAAPWGPSAITGSAFLLDGTHLIAQQVDSLLWFRPGAQTVLVPKRARLMRHASGAVWWQTTSGLWTQTRLDAAREQPALDDHTLHHAGRTLGVSANQGLSLDGRPLPFRFPDDMQGHFGIVVDGAYPIEGTSYVLLVIGRQSAHGGHFVFDRVLAVDLRDGSVGRVGPQGALPLGFDTHANFHRWRTLDASARGLWMRTGRNLWLAPLDGSAARPVGVLDAAEGSLGPATVARDGQRIAFVQAGRVVVWDAERMAEAAHTPPLQAPSWKWAPHGHALAIAGRPGSFALGEDGSLRSLGCAVLAGESQSPLLDVLPETASALVCVDGQLAVSQPGRCVRHAELSCYQAIPIAWGETHR